MLARAAYATKGDHEQALPAGVNEQISKPIDIEKMIKLMAKWVV